MTRPAFVKLGPPPTALRDKLAQLIFVRIGSNMPPVRTVEDDEERAVQLLEVCLFGGLLLFRGGPAAKASLSRLQRASRVPLLIGADIERGVGQQIDGYTLFPHAMAFEMLGSKSASSVAQFAGVLAREAQDVGIHITFGPVADVNTNPNNPIIATRAFSEDSTRAVELTRAFVAAAESAGLLTTAKHFPGHGQTHKDSHDSLPTVTRSRHDLDTCELPPFQAAIDAGCSLVMTAHVAFPAADSSAAPATLSPFFLQEVLRKKMGFRGAVCSDSLLMAGVRDRFQTEHEMALAVLSAGVDLLLDLEDPATVLDYLCECAQNGTLSSNRVDEAFERVWTLKQRVFSGAPRVALADDKPTQNAAALAERIARDAIEIIRGTGTSALPLNPGEALGAILLKPFETALDPPEQPLAAALRERFRDVRYAQIGPNADAAAFKSARQMAADVEQLLIAVIVRPAAWHTFGLRPAQCELVRQLTRRQQVVLASLGVPYVLKDYPNAALRICTYSDVPVSQRALAELLASG